MKLTVIEEQRIERAVNTNGVITPADPVWIFDVSTPQGTRRVTIAKATQPDDDEVIAELGLPVTNERLLRASNVAARIDVGAELAAKYLSLRELSEVPDFTTLFTAGERARITGARDNLLAQIKAYI